MGLCVGWQRCGVQAEVWWGGAAGRHNVCPSVTFHAAHATQHAMHAGTGGGRQMGKQFQQQQQQSKVPQTSEE